MTLHRSNHSRWILIINGHGTIKMLLLHLCLHSFLQTGSGSSDSDEYDGDDRVGSSFGSKSNILIIVLVITFFVLGFFSIYIRQCFRSSNRSLPSTIGGIRQPCTTARGLDAAAVEAFPTFLYSTVKEVKIGKGELECAVCLNEFTDDETLRLIPVCNHVFHSDCVGAWLSFHATCPVCRANLDPSGSKKDPVIDPSESTSNNQMDTQNTSDDHGVVRQIIESSGERNSYNTASKSKSPGLWSIGFLQRSHSTGGSLDNNREKFTLILPEDIRNQLMNSTSRSPKSGYRNEMVEDGKNYFYYDRPNQEGRLDRRPFSMTPPFFSQVASNLGRKGGCGRLGVDSTFKKNEDGVGEGSMDRLWTRDNIV